MLNKNLKILDKYSDFVNVFSEEKTMMLPECNKLNKYAIKLEDGKQLPYRLIYNLGPIELKTLKTYIKIHLKTGFIWPFKSFADALIFFDKKPNGNFCLCNDYQSLNNLTIINWYVLPLIRKLLDQLGQAKKVIPLDLNNAYYQMRIKEGD